MDDRGGTVLKTGKIGRTNVLRQQVMMPGERIDTNISGSVKLESLRERDALRINAHLATFMTPMRWIEPNWSNYLKEGPDSVNTPAVINDFSNLHALGIGAYVEESGVNIPQFYRDAALRVYNEWYKWPEDPDANVWEQDGLKAVPLSHAWTRCRYSADPADTSDYTQASATSFDVRDLAETQAKFRAAMERDVLSYNRYMELVREMYSADGSREVDQVPIMVDQTEVGVNPREMPATDGASLGQWQSIYDFEVDHRIGGITCPEHCVLTYVLTIRFAPILEGRSPLSRGSLDWEDRVGDPEILQASSPQRVQLNDVVTTGSGSTTELGYLPAGWRWRSGFDVIGRRIDVRDSFPYMKIPSTKEDAKDATRVKEAFRSQSLGDYVVDLYFQEQSRNLLSGSLESYFAGMKGRGSNSEYPKQGKML
jgi:hypothetical protein